MKLAVVVVALLTTASEALVPSQPPPSKAVAVAKRVAKDVASLAVASALVLAPLTPSPALAARSGGRAGGSFRSAPSRSYSAPRTRVRTFAAPVPVPVPVAPFGGYGYGGYGYGGGFGISPGAYLGLSLLDAIVDEQRRAAYLRQQLETQQQLGKDAGQIESLKAQLDAQDKRIAELQAQADKAK